MFTLVVVAVAVSVSYSFYQRNFSRPWTRDGQVSAQVIRVAARVSAPVTKVHVMDNQYVKAGDPLFELDARTYQAALDQAQAAMDLAVENYQVLDQRVKASESQVTVAQANIPIAESEIQEAEANFVNAKAEYERQQSLLPRQATSQKIVDQALADYRVADQKRKSAAANMAQAQASLQEALFNLTAAKASRGEVGDKNSKIREAKANLTEAQLNLQFTKITASVDGYVTNLNIRVGTQAVANQPILALVDVHSYWVNGFFKETLIKRVAVGDAAVVTLMSYPDQPIQGEVESLGWAIAQDDGSTGPDLLPRINASFDWIRLAQRIPVKIHLKDVPEGIKLRVGSTASILIHTVDDK